jgi:hypothetical protein
MKNLVLSIVFFASSSALADSSVGTCMDKVSDGASKAVSSKIVQGEKVDRVAIKSVDVDLWSVHPTYLVKAVGITYRGADQEFNFGAQPDKDCSFGLIELNQ